VRQSTADIFLPRTCRTLWTRFRSPCSW